MRRSPQPRRLAKLSDSIRRQLGMYALAASAAGVGVLALSQPSEAKIVYTPANYPLRRNFDYAIDLNHDGIADLTIRDWSTQTTSGFRSDVLSARLRGNLVEGSSMPFALKRKVRIGPPWNSQSSELMALASPFRQSGNASGN